MSNKTWKQAERRVAVLFGARRRTGSGSDYRTGADDLMHDRLHVEIKYRQSHGVFTWWREVLDAVRKEKRGKQPVVVLVEKGSPVLLAVVPLDPTQLRYLATELEKNSTMKVRLVKDEEVVKPPTVLRGFNRPTEDDEVIERTP